MRGLKLPDWCCRVSLLGFVASGGLGNVAACSSEATGVSPGAGGTDGAGPAMAQPSNAERMEDLGRGEAEADGQAGESSVALGAADAEEAARDGAGGTTASEGSAHDGAGETGASSNGAGAPSGGAATIGTSGADAGSEREVDTVPEYAQAGDQCDVERGCRVESEELAAQLNCYPYWLTPPSGTLPDQPQACESDAECRTGALVDDDSWVCAGARGCQRSCVVEDVCMDGEICLEASGLCMTVFCESSLECFGNTVCQGGQCARKSCTSNADCADYCVSGQCSKWPGRCANACAGGCP